MRTRENSADRNRCWYNGETNASAGRRVAKYVLDPFTCDIIRDIILLGELGEHIHLSPPPTEGTRNNTRQQMRMTTRAVYVHFNEYIIIIVPNTFLCERLNVVFTLEIITARHRVQNLCSGWGEGRRSCTRNPWYLIWYIVHTTRRHGR